MKIIKFKGEYENGMRLKGKEYYENSVIKFEGEYKNGAKWKGKEYNEKGEIFFKGEYKKESYSSENFWMGYIYKDSKIIGTYKNGDKLDGYINLEIIKNGIIFDGGDNLCSGHREEYIYDELIFEGNILIIVE